jgi:hypothetical protein
MSALSFRRLPAVARGCVAAVLCALAWGACSGAADGPGKARAPVKIGRRIYQGAVDGRGVLFFEASDTALTLAYDTLLCGVYAAWKGPAVGDSVRVDGSYAVQGALYHRLAANRIWTVRNAQGTLAFSPRFRGFTEDSTGYVAFRYVLPLSKADSIVVVEEPSWDDHYGDNALRRDFHLAGIPPGDTVQVLLGGARGKWTEKWELSGGGRYLGVPDSTVLELADDGVSSTKVRWEGSAAP